MVLVTSQDSSFVEEGERGVIGKDITRAPGVLLTFLLEWW